jgi:hypothetical protein
MSKFTAAENFTAHTANMDYTAIKNMQAQAIDEQDWATLAEADELERAWEAAQ